MSKQAKVEAIFKIRNEGYNGSELSLNCFELLNDRLFCGSQGSDFIQRSSSSSGCYTKLWVIRNKLFNFIQVGALSLLSFRDVAATCGGFGRPENWSLKSTAYPNYVCARHESLSVCLSVRLH